MCDGLRSLRESITAYAAGFDARLLSVADAGVVVGLCVQSGGSAGLDQGVRGSRLGRGGGGGGWRVSLGGRAAGRSGRYEPDGGAAGA